MSINPLHSRKFIALFVAAGLFIWLPAMASPAASQEMIKPDEITDNIFASSIISEQVYIMVGERGRIYRSPNAGSDWLPVKSGTNDNLLSISFCDDSHGWITGDRGSVFFTRNGGLTWESQVSGTERDLLAVNFADPQNGVAAGDWGMVVMTGDGGKSWEKAALDDDVVLYDAQMIEPGRAVVAGEFGAVYETSDFGKTWHPLTSEDTSLEESVLELPKTLFSIDIDQEVIFAAGIDGVVKYTENWGQSWEIAENHSKASLYNIEMTGCSGWAVGDLGTILRTEDRGRTWHTIDLPLHYKMSWICALDVRHNSPSAGFAAGSKGLYIEIDDGDIKR